MNKTEDHKNDALGQNKEFTLIVNATQKIWKEKTISFEQVVMLAFGNYENNGITAYTVTYKKGEDKKPEGTMVKGDTIHVKDKMIFNVSATNKS